MPLSYEKLLRMYFKCGLIVHDDQGCKNSISSTSQSSGMGNQFGPWLSAIPDTCKRLMAGPKKFWKDSSSRDNPD